MDSTTFDTIAVRVGRGITLRPSRRAAVRLLAGGLLGGLLAQRGAALAHARRPDRDRDGLYDDDEVNEYGTDPGNPDTDGDGDDDGLEVFNGTDPRVNGNAPPAPVCGANQMDCGGVCVDHVTDPYNCGYCGRVCPAGAVCEFATCRAPACVANGESCMADFNCCSGRCAKRGVDAKGICEAVLG